MLVEQMIDRLAARIEVPDDYREQLARWRNRGVTYAQFQKAAREALQADIADEDRWLKFATVCWDIAMNNVLLGRLLDTKIMPKIPEEN